MSVVVLYGSPDCCLCTEARTAIERVQREIPFDLREVNINDDPAAQRAYFERIPVVLVDGIELCSLRLDEPGLRARLAAADGFGAAAMI